MNVATQISGVIQPGNKTFIALKSMLSHIGINVAHQINDESLFYANTSQAWQHYEQELAFYRAIASSSFHIVYNDQPINNEVGLQILYAMLKGRPIVMTGAPTFERNLNPFIRETLTKHLREFHSINLPELELTELSMLLHKLKTTTYSLSKHEKVLINAGVKALFRSFHAKN
ncbi:MAG TPA: hypothetical protein VIQ80_02485 [Candidatus Saccharimonadales bacterium]